MSFSMAIMHTLLFSCFCQNLSKYLTVINLLFHVHAASSDHHKCSHISLYVSLSARVLCVYHGCSLPERISEKIITNIFEMFH